MSTLSHVLVQKKFFSSPNFAVVGASKDQSKFGTKVLKWYQNHDKTVTPIHPKEDTLEGLVTLRKLSDLPSPSTTSVSIVTPAPQALYSFICTLSDFRISITLSLLKEAKELDIPALWLQPGAENEEVKSYITQAELQDRVIFGGPCVLVSGEGIIKSLL